MLVLMQLCLRMLLRSRIKNKMNRKGIDGKRVNGRSEEWWCVCVCERQKHRERQGRSSRALPLRMIL
jgi:hypothetical protein